MRLSLSLFCVLLAFSISACGKKKKSEPEDKSANVGPYNGPPGPQGKTGEQGPPGIPGGTLNYSVKDWTGQVIGKTSWENYAHFNDGEPFSVQLLDGAIFPVNPSDGVFAGKAYCQYASNNCTGTCLYSGLAGTSNKIIEGSAGLYWLNSAATLSAKNYSSSWSVDEVLQTRQCTMEIVPAATMAVELPNLWSKPAGFTYPVPVPMDVSEIASGFDEFED
jgi:hypothetical protein